MSTSTHIKIGLAVAALAYVVFFIGLFAHVSDLMIFSPVAFVGGVLWAGLTDIESRHAR